MRSAWRSCSGRKSLSCCSRYLGFWPDGACWVVGTVDNDVLCKDLQIRLWFCGDDKLLLLLWSWRCCPRAVGMRAQVWAKQRILGHPWECFLSAPPATPQLPPPCTHRHTTPPPLCPGHIQAHTRPPPSSLPPSLHLLALFWWEEYHSTRKGSEIVLEHNGFSTQAASKVLVLLVHTGLRVL